MQAAPSSPCSSESTNAGELVTMSSPVPQSPPHASAKSSLRSPGCLFFFCYFLNSCRAFRIQHRCGRWHVDSGQKSGALLAADHPVCAPHVNRPLGVQSAHEDAVRTRSHMHTGRHHPAAVGARVATASLPAPLDHFSFFFSGDGLRRCCC